MEYYINLDFYFVIIITIIITSRVFVYVNHKYLYHCSNNAKYFG